jgi:hypothetical protein
MQTAQTACYPLTALSLLATLVLLAYREQGALTLSIMGALVTTLGIGGSVLCLFTAGTKLRRSHWTRFPINFAMILLLNAGLMVSNSRAVIEALTGTKSVFVRTPKRGARSGTTVPERRGPTGIGELLSGCGLAAALAYEAGWLSPLFSLSFGGLMLVGLGLARERWLAMAERAGLIRAGRRTGDQPAG